MVGTGPLVPPPSLTYPTHPPSALFIISTPPVPATLISPNIMESLIVTCKSNIYIISGPQIKRIDLIIIYYRSDYSDNYIFHFFQKNLSFPRYPERQKQKKALADSFFFLFYPVPDSWRNLF